MAIVSARGGRPWTFYVLAAIFVGYVVFLYGPMLCIYVLSFQGPQGGLTFPMRGAGLHWFDQLLSQGDTGDLIGAISRSLPLAVLVMVITVVVSFAAGMAFRARFPGSNWLFYLVVASLVAPGYVLSIGIGLMFQLLGWNTNWYTSALGAQLPGRCRSACSSCSPCSAATIALTRRRPATSAPSRCRRCGWLWCRCCCQA